MTTPRHQPGTRVLVTGGKGQVGRELAAFEGWDVRALGRAELDVTDRGSIEEALARTGANRLVHCAAWTAVDDAESQRAAALRVNEHGSRTVAEACAAAGVHMVHVSTEMIFDGRDPLGYEERAEPRPISAYGESKLAAERAVLAAHPDACIARTSWVFGEHGSNFVTTIARLAATRDVLDVVSDQMGRPTWARHLAGALLQLAQDEAFGTFHVADEPVVTKAGWARAIIAAAGLATDVRDVTSAHFPLPAARPMCAVLHPTREDTPGMGDWHDGLAVTLAALELPAER